MFSKGKSLFTKVYHVLIFFKKQGTSTHSAL